MPTHQVSTVFGGLYFDASTLPWALRWVPRVSVVRLAWDGMVAYETGAVDGTWHGAEGELLLMTAVLYALAFVGLWLRRPQFARLGTGRQDLSKRKTD